MSDTVLSILICSLDKRAAMLATLLKELDRQIKEGDAEEKIELLVNLDNKNKTTGRKRQELLEGANGKYVIYHDDDDWCEPCYISELLKAAESDADCFAINGWITTNGINIIDWRISKDYDNVTIKENGKQVYLRKTNHITAVKREIALKGGFPDKSNAEDKAYSESINPFLKTEHIIIPPLYHYRYSSLNKEYK